MGHYRLYIVSKEHAPLYDALRREFADDSWTSVVVDRRAPASGAAETDRRSAPELIDAHLRWFGWAVVTIDGTLKQGTA